MQINEKLQELYKELPRGSIKVLSDNTGLRQNTIIDIFKGRSQPNITTLQKIVPEVIKLVNEQKKLKEMLGIED